MSARKYAIQGDYEINNEAEQRLFQTD